MRDANSAQKPTVGYILHAVMGACGSGKTTYLQRYTDCILLDLEQILDTLQTGQRKYHSAVRAVSRAALIAGYHRALDLGVNIGITLDGATRGDRAIVLDPARGHGYHIDLVHLRTPAERCIERAKADPKRPQTTHWPPIINRHFRRFETPDPIEYDSYRCVTPD